MLSENPAGTTTSEDPAGPAGPAGPADPSTLLDLTIMENKREMRSNGKNADCYIFLFNGKREIATRR